MNDVQVYPHEQAEEYIANYQATLDAHRESVLHGLKSDLRLAGEHYRKMGVILEPFKSMSKLNTPYVDWIKVMRGFLSHDDHEADLKEFYDQGETILDACHLMF